MNKQKYSGYTVGIFKADDESSASAKGEDIKVQFPGADYELVDGNPCRQSAFVRGMDKKIKNQIEDWVNSTG